MAKHNRGSAIIISCLFKDNSDPFTDPVFFDPISPTITVRDPEGMAKVSAQALTKKAVGKYSYIIQTATTWLAGEYEIEINATSGSYNDKTIKQNGFILI